MNGAAICPERTGAYLVFEDVNFGIPGTITGFSAQVKTGQPVGWIELRLDNPDGPQIGLCQVAYRDTGEGWNTVQTGIYGAEGVHGLYLIFKSTTMPLFELRGFEFTQDIAPTPQLGLPVRAPYLGPLEDYFLGGGMAGGGGMPNGRWNYLIGPIYTCDNYIANEEIRMVIDGMEQPLNLAMRRGRGTGVFYDVQMVQDLAVHLIEFAPQGEPLVIRLFAVENRSDSKSYSVQIRAYLSPAPAAIVWYREHKGTLVTPVTGTALELTEATGNGGTFSLTFNVPTQPISTASGEHVLETAPLPVAPGALVQAGLYHFAHRREQDSAWYVNAIRARDPLADLRNCITQWQAWTAGGINLDTLPDQHLRDIIDGAAVMIKMQQGSDGGIMATPRTYETSYIRDNHGATRGLLAAGHPEEVRRFLLWTLAKYRELQKQGRFGIPNAGNIGREGVFAGFGDAGNWSAETPGLLVLIARNYYRQTGDLQTLQALDEMLRFGVDVQLRYAAVHDWRLLFNGDETEHFGAGIQTADVGGQWSMPSLVICIACVDFFITYLQATGQSELIPGYQQQLVHLQESLDRHFWRADLGLYDWYRGADDEWPRLRQSNYHLFPVCLGAKLAHPERLAQTVQAIKASFTEAGFLPNQPGGANEDFCGHNLGYLLFALCELNDPLQTAVYQALTWGGTMGCWGTWSEAYTAAGLAYGKAAPDQVYQPAQSYLPAQPPNPPLPYAVTWDNRIHNLRPFETGFNLEAILKYWKKMKDEL